MASKPNTPPTLMDLAAQQYPYLADKNIAYAYTPDPKSENMLEFYSPEETDRPESLPSGQVGVQVFNPNTKPSDLLADYVSHYATQKDPKIKPLYDAFASTLDNKMMLDRYNWDVKNAGEKRPYEDWLKISGLPAVFRGYTFRQWPDSFNNRFYSPKQKQILDQIRALVGYK